MFIRSLLITLIASLPTDSNTRSSEKNLDMNHLQIRTPEMQD